MMAAFGEAGTQITMCNALASDAELQHVTPAASTHAAWWRTTPTLHAAEAICIVKGDCAARADSDST